MLRVILPVLMSLSLVACATEPKAMTDNQPRLQNAVFVTEKDTDNLTELSAQNGVEPCPRFLDSLNQAESIIQAQPKDYVHML